MTKRRAVRALRGGGAWVLVPLFLLFSTAASAQTGGQTSGQTSAEANGDPAADSAAALLARADSARAALLQPPGSYGGVRAMDVIRLPFQLFGATLALGLYGVGAVYLIADELVIDPALAARESLAEIGIDADVDAFGNRSWPGVILRYERLSPFYAEAGYTLRRYEHYEAGVELGNPSFGAAAFGGYDTFRQPHFWGVGPDSREEDRSDYSQEVGTVGASGWWSPSGGPLTLSGGAGWESSRVGGRGWDSSRPNASDVFDSGLLFGLDDRTEYLRVGAGALLDRTHVESLQVRGSSLRGDWQYYQGLNGTASSFHRVAGDARLFVPANDRQLLALRLLAEDHLGEREDGVPFTHLARLGDEEGLRGFSGRRFRDRALLAAQVEWRYEVAWHPGFAELGIEGFAFADVGAVGSSLGAIGRSDFRATPGIGLRFVDRGDAQAEAFVARGDGRWRLGFGFGRSY